MKKRILSGMRPTGKLHLGHLAGALENWVKLQDEYSNFHLVADWHALTTAADRTEELAENTREMVIDWLSAGIDPQKSPIFVQSHIPEHAELFLIFSMLITVPRLERNPAVKEQAQQLNLEDRMAYGHLGYPVLQAADILLYKGDLVPVGEDQVPHLEISRELARRFNKLYKKIFPEPEAKLTDFGRLLGTDARRMAKSLNNSILIADSTEVITKKIKRCITDPARVHKNDPGHPEICPIYYYHKKFHPATLEDIKTGCIEGTLGCVEHKNDMTRKLIDYLEPMWEKREYYEQHPALIDEIIEDGDRRARQIAGETMAEVREAMKLP
ncbi:tryptophan--tRNA ligase [candidate division LCP-89 bacterium B3_LCP]|uniref:Tryptophan--tRNA ligase n=1 Tax=candidate division LCP-89 bacterium B3_LCP TaxID=2012998 RepID=A0A532UZC4_UNCL8|nr:MAG: tryptophan--tRNA ligase [candidate division LCP-89 bacterium B3_LCP]